MSSCRVAVCVGMALGISACAAPSEQAMSADTGWRVVHVDRVLPAGERPSAVSPSQDCRLSMQDSAADQAWLLVHYRRPPIMVFRVVPATEHRDYERGEQVWINVSDCRLQPQRRLLSAKVNGI